MLISPSKPVIDTTSLSRVTAMCKFPSLAAMPAVISGSSHSANILVTLLSFLAPEKIPLDLLSRGATPRARWTVQGETERLAAFHAHLVPELRSLLSDIQRLSDAFHELDQLSAVSKNSDETYTLDDVVAGRVRESLSPELNSFWRCQALTVTYRAIPWKYIESA
jgi:hypothetical protein